MHVMLCRYACMCACPETFVLVSSNVDVWKKEEEEESLTGLVINTLYIFCLYCTNVAAFVKPNDKF